MGRHAPLRKAAAQCRAVERRQGRLHETAVSPEACHELRRGEGVRQVAAPATGRQQFQPRTRHLFQHQYAAPGGSGFDRGHQPRRPGSDDDDVPYHTMARTIPWATRCRQCALRQYRCSSRPCRTPPSSQRSRLPPYHITAEVPPAFYYHQDKPATFQQNTGSDYIFFMVPPTRAPQPAWQRSPSVSELASEKTARAPGLNLPSRTECRSQTWGNAEPARCRGGCIPNFPQYGFYFVLSPFAKPRAMRHMQVGTFFVRTGTFRQSVRQRIRVVSC